MIFLDVTAAPVLTLAHSPEYYRDTDYDESQRPYKIPHINPDNIQVSQKKQDPEQDKTQRNRQNSSFLRIIYIFFKINKSFFVKTVLITRPWSRIKGRGFLL